MYTCAESVWNTQAFPQPLCFKISLSSNFFVPPTNKNFTVHLILSYLCILQSSLHPHHLHLAPSFQNRSLIGISHNWHTPQLACLPIKEFRGNSPTRFPRNSISNVTIRNNREILPSFGGKWRNSEEVVCRSRSDQRNGLESFLARGRRALLDSALQPETNHPWAKSQLKFVWIFSSNSK